MEKQETKMRITKKEDIKEFVREQKGEFIVFVEFGEEVAADGNYEGI